MAQDTPDLEDLPFYQQLISTYNDLYSRVQESCSIVVIPQIKSNVSSLSREIFESHIFRPSPLYRSKHVSWNDKFEIQCDSNRAIRVIDKKCGGGPRLIKILGQEEVSNSHRRRNYTIYIVEQPFVDLTPLKTSPNSQLRKAISIPTNLSTPRFDLTEASYETAFIYLDSLRKIEPVFTELRNQLFLFNEKCVVLVDYIEETIERLRQHRTKFLQDSYRLLNKTCQDRDLELASEIYVTGYTYTKVWPVIVRCSESKNQTLIENIRRRALTQQTTTNRHERTADQMVFNELKKLNDLKSAYEKAKCIRSVLDLTVSAKQLRSIDLTRSTATYRPTSDSDVMSADETLDAFNDLLCRFLLTDVNTKSISLPAHEFYMEKFRFISLPQEIDYAFTTYQVAIEYLTSSASCI